MSSLSLIDKKRAYDTLVDVWMEHLNTYEFVVATVLVRILVGYDFDEYALSLSSLQDGIKSNDGSGWFVAPLKRVASLASMRRALASLEEKGVINVARSDRKTSKYSINLEWKMPLRLPKRLQEKRPMNREMDENGSGIDQNYAPTDHSLCSDRAQNYAPTEQLNTRNKEKVLRDSFSTLRAEGADQKNSSENPAERMAAVKNQSRENLVQRVAKSKEDGRVSTTDLEAAFKAAYLETYAGAPFKSWSVKEKSMAKRMASKFSNTNGSIIEFIEFSVREWRRVKSERLAFMQSMADYPSIQVLCGDFICSKFMDAFAARAMRPDDFDRSEEAQIRRLMNGGLTYEQAIKEYGRSQGRVEAQREAKRDAQQVTLQMLAEQQAQEERNRAAAEQRRKRDQERQQAREREKSAEPVAAEAQGDGYSFLPKMDDNYDWTAKP